MRKELSKYDIDFVRRVSKEIVCCLLPDELSFFDIVWQAIGPLLKELNICSLEHTDYAEILTERLRGQALAAPWSRDADLLTGPLIMILGTSLHSAIAKGFCEEEEIGQLIAQYSLHYPLPDQFLRMAQVFVTGICGGVAEIDEKTKRLLREAELSVPHQACYYVFHNGNDHFYQDTFPEEVTNLHKTVLFWINPAEKEFFSRGKPREKSECPRPKTIAMLRFLCDERNAGKTVSFSELYSRVWGTDDLSNIGKMIGSIDVAENELNTFAEERFISDKSKKDNAKVLRMHGEQKFYVTKEAPQECCIVKKFIFAK
jgi:hypothetical protein